MNNTTNPPISAATLPGLSDNFMNVDDLSESPWTTLVMTILACVAVALFAAGAYAGGV